MSDEKKPQTEKKPGAFGKILKEFQTLSLIHI